MVIITILLWAIGVLGAAVVLLVVGLLYVIVDWLMKQFPWIG